MENFHLKKTIFLSVILLFLFIAGSFSGCSGSKEIKTEPGKKKKYVFFPPLPAKPKYQYLTTFSTSGDVEKKKSKFFKFVAGDETRKDIIIRKAHGVEVFEGIIYVCDSKKGYVVTLDLKNNKFGYFGIRGQGRLMKPVNIKIDKKNRLIYVADMGRKQVVSFNLNGDTVRIYGKMKEFSPSDVDVKDNSLFICDVKGHQVHVLDIKTGELRHKIGKRGHGEGDLYHPSNICIYKNKIFVSDTTNFRISIFDIEGNYIENFGGIGDRPGNFSRNKGIDIDKEGRIYVVDTAFQNVQVFNNKFELLLFMFGPGPERYNIYIPAVVTVNYESLKYFEKYISPDFKAEYILLVTSNFGFNKVNVYAFGEYAK